MLTDSVGREFRVQTSLCFMLPEPQLGGNRKIFLVEVSCSLKDFPHLFDVERR